MEPERRQDVSQMSMLQIPQGKYLPTLEPERRKDVYQMSMLQIPQGNIYQPWNQREDKTFIRCPCYRYHKVVSTNLGIKEKTRRFSDVHVTDTTM